MRIRGSARFVAGCLLVAATLTGCTTDWGTWGNGTQRNGANTAEWQIGTGNVAHLHQVWARPLLGNVNFSPIVASGVRVGSSSIDIAYVGDEHGGFTAINMANGAVVWGKVLGAQTEDCDDSPDHAFGTSSTGVLDRQRNLVYVAAADGKVHALDLSTGAEAPGWPVTVTTDPVHEYVQAALTAGNGFLYAGTSSHCDIGPYQGRIVAIGIASHTIEHTFNITNPADKHGGSMWGWGGASIDPRNGDVYAATGNAVGIDENTGYANRVVRLTPDLAVVASNQPPLIGGDDDFGSTPVLFQRSGCPAQLAVMRKDGHLYLYNRDQIANGPTQSIQVQGFTFVGVPAFSAQDNLLYVASAVNSNDGTYVSGMHAFALQGDCTLRLWWQRQVPINAAETTSTPTIANGVVYYGDGFGNTVRAFNARSGAPLWTSGSTVGGAIFAAPVVVNGTLLVGAWDGKLHAWRP